MDSEVVLQIGLVSPPRGVGFGLQKGKGEIVAYQVSDGSNIEFELSVRIKRGKTGAPNFLGEFTQGTPSERFVYLCVGEYAGQRNAEWARRVKIHLSGISWSQVNKVLKSTGGKLVSSYQATAKDGSPSCASVPLIGDGWSVVEA